MNAALIIASILSIMYGAYIIEIYRYLSDPIMLNTNQHRKTFTLLFFFGLCAMIALAYTLREMVLPIALFNLIVTTLQMLIIIPFFCAIIPDRILISLYQKRLPAPIKIITLITTGLIGSGSIALMLSTPLAQIETITNTLSYAIDLISLFLLIIMVIGSTLFIYRSKTLKK